MNILKRDFVKLILWLAASMLLLALNVFFSIIMIAVTVAYYYIKRGFMFWVYGSCTAFVMLLASLGFNAAAAGMISLYILPVSLLIGLGFKKESSFKTIIISAGVVHTVVNASVLAYMARAAGQTVGEMLFSNTLSGVRDILQQSPELAPGLLAELDSYSDAVASMFELLLPSFLLLSSCFTVYLIFGIVRGVLGKTGRIYDNMPYFYQFRLHKSVTVLFLVLLIISQFAVASPVIVNILLVMFVIVAVSGLSVADYYLKLYRVPGVLRAIIYFMVIVVAPMFGELGALPVLCLFGAGTVDSFYGLRRDPQL